MLVLERKLSYRMIPCQIDRIDLVSHTHGMTLSDQLIAQKSDRGVIVHTFGQRGNLIAIRQIYLINLRLTMPNAREIDTLAISAPAIRVHVGVKILAYECFLTRLQIHYHQAILIRLVTIPFHT